MADAEDLRVTATLVIPAHELRWTFTPSGGPGGQHANRANTRAEVRFDVVGSGALTTSQRERLLGRLGPVVAGVADDERSQARNRRLARERLRRRLEAGLRVERSRRPSRPTRAAVERRLEAKRRRSSRKSERRLDRGGDHER